MAGADYRRWQVGNYVGVHTSATRNDIRASSEQPGYSRRTESRRSGGSELIAIATISVMRSLANGGRGPTVAATISPLQNR